MWQQYYVLIVYGFSLFFTCIGLLYNKDIDKVPRLVWTLILTVFNFYVLYSGHFFIGLLS